MISRKISFRDVLQGTRKFLLMKAGRALFSVNLEVTRRCNARCGFCDYWHQGDNERPLRDYSPIIRHLNPLHLTITGGEPLLRSDLERVIRSIKENSTFIYMNLITNGSLLNVERALSLWDAGLNQLSISLDFPDERHDRQRGLPGLWRHLKEILPTLSGSKADNLTFNTVIMKDNLGDLLSIARMAREWGYKVSYSTYNPFKIGKQDHLIPLDQMPALERVVEELLIWKRRYRNIINSDFYLKNVVQYIRRGGIPNCLAGRKWVQVSPNGELRRCSDKEFLPDWPEFRPNRISITPCMECYYACRGEAEAPLGLKRILELNR